MANKNPKTKKPTGLSITRNGNDYTFKWKIAAKDHGGGQTLQYAVNGGGWTAKTVGVAATSASVTVANVASIRFRIRGKRKKDKEHTYAVSDWSECLWTATVPATPSLSYSNEGTNKGTFTWSTASDAAGRAVVTGVQAQTCYERHSSASSFGGAALMSKPISGSELVIEDTETFADGMNIVRWYRVRSYGPGGYSPWVAVFHAYGAPKMPVITSAKGLKYDNDSMTQLHVGWQLAYSNQFPVDKVKVQYVTGVPTDYNMSAPASGWSDAIEVTANGITDKVVVNVQSRVGDDECMWVRVIAEHGGLTSYSPTVVARYGKLKAPTLDAVPNVTTGSVDITITEETTCEAADTAIFVRPENDPSHERFVADLPRGTTTKTITVPEIVGATHTCFIAFAYIGLAFGSDTDGYSFQTIKMTSDRVMDSDVPAVAPANVTVEAGPEENSVRLSWKWSWGAATRAEISWADSEYSWESTNEPTKYELEDGKTTSWIVAGLEPDKAWYFRVRLIDGSGDNDVIGPWSETVSYGSSSTVNRPVLRLNKNVINEGDTVVARWAFASSGSATQDYAEICLVTFDEGTGDPVYGDVIARAEEEHSVEISQDWETDETYNLAVRVTSTNGNQSEWSEPVGLFVAPPASITLSYSNMSLRSPDGGVANNQYTETVETTTTTIVGDESTSVVTTTDIARYFNGDKNGIEDYLYGKHPTSEYSVDDDTTTIVTKVYSFDFGDRRPTLSASGMLIDIAGAGDAGTTLLSVIRAEDYHLDRPDEKDYNGYAGETMVTHSQLGEDRISIHMEDFVEPLDNGCKYFLIGKIIDEYGQPATFEYPFWVDYQFSAHMPAADVQIDPYQRIAIITTKYEDGYNWGAGLDIYRLSADGPKLIYKNAQPNKQYVDPYPAIGAFGGHRIVHVVSGNYITSDGRLAWHDTDVSDGDYFNEESMIIDVDGDQIVLPYDIQLSNKWNKDFKRTSYLGGSVQGDWNPAVTRDITANTVLVRGDDLDRQVAMRDLAGYAGIAHVRTPDGSSITCNVQIDESQSYDSKKVSYTLTMQAIDSDELEGMTLAEWEELHPVGE